MITFPNAKINIGLQVTERRSDGYHNLDTVFYPIPLCDALEVIVAEGAEYDCRLHLSGVDIAGNPDSNLVVRAYRLLAADYTLPPVDIYLHKHIPTGAGLGGGSADASYMLRMLNEMFSLDISTDKLEKYAAQLGADCPFFITCNPVYATGIGNEFHPITLNLDGWNLVVVKPEVFVSTKEAYSMVHPKKPEVTLDKKITAPISEWKSTISNDFEQGIFALHPELLSIKKKLYELGAVYAAMSGSGSALFGLFTEPIEGIEKHFTGCFCDQQKLPDSHRGVSQ
ncbi:MAG: 4-(cytidine 5'-diphospho)-2-C-methyl-D-erythritol kinase [Alistipes sp.]|nr:4-(cytidine 5'-diphospho)-2-C-methyl-D-erythritol kinase [Alistipes sp.]